MKIFAISDLHLSTTVDKPMDVFGGNWDNYWGKIQQDWLEKVNADDIVLISGDISWATLLQDAVSDFEAIHKLPGRKVIIKGNHDYWWNSYSKVKAVLPDSIQAIQNNAIMIDDVIICGTRLWTIPYDNNPDDVKIYEREKMRIKLSLDSATSLGSGKIIVMTHYPPFNQFFDDNEVTDLIAQYNVSHVVYGHLHGKDARVKHVVDKKGVRYLLASCDLVDNKLVLLQ